MCTQNLFRDLHADDPEPETTEVESLCMQCGDNGITKILLTKIPFYKEVVLMSFECEHCGFSNNEIQSGGKIQDKGVILQLRVTTERDLNRQVVKSDYAIIKIPELEFEVPSQSQKGEITTIEGIIDRTIRGLEQDQTVRRTLDEDSAMKIDLFILKLNATKLLKSPFTLIIEDPSGNSFIENPKVPYSDPELVLTHFLRTEDQNKLMGMYATGSESNEIPTKDEVLTFETNCPNCNVVCNTNMKLTSIPYFKDVVIMATNCDACGHRTNEVKSGGGIEPKGCKMTLHIQKMEDLSRDVLTSETCSIEITELALEVGGGALGGRFTTVEGVLHHIKEQLTTGYPLFMGDSAEKSTQEKIQDFVKRFDDILTCKLQVHLILDDPTGNSYIQDLYTPEPDPQLVSKVYVRTFEQNEELGLNDMKVENYENLDQ